MTDNLMVQILVQGGALGLLAFVLWRSGAFIATLLTRVVDVWAEGARAQAAVLAQIAASVEQHRREDAERAGQLRELILSEATRNRHDARNALQAVHEAMVEHEERRPPKR